METACTAHLIRLKPTIAHRQMKMLPFRHRPSSSRMMLSLSNTLREARGIASSASLVPSGMIFPG